MGVYPDEAGSVDGALRWMERCPTVKGTEPEVHTPRTKTWEHQVMPNDVHATLAPVVFFMAAPAAHGRSQARV